MAAWAVIAASIGILCPNQTAQADDPVVEYRDVGGPSDFDGTQNIFFDAAVSFGGNSWPKYWNMDHYCPAVSATVAIGGSGYKVGDVLTLQGGQGEGKFVTFTVATLSGSAVATVTLKTTCPYSARPTNPVVTTVSPSGGTGCTLNVTWTGTYGAFYENDTNFWWVTPPPVGTTNLTSSRCIKFHHYGRFRVKAGKFPSSGDLILSLRIKDDIIAPAPVFVWNGGSNWKQLGTVGGQNDHWWKTSTFRVRASDRQIDNGTFVFKVGVNAYSSSIKGELNIDRIQLSTVEDHSLFPADKAGLWPLSAATNFANLGQTMEYISGQGPLFLFGVYAGGDFSDGGSQTQAGHGANDTWQILQNLGMNTYVVSEWQKTWVNQWSMPSGPTYASPAHYVKIGFVNDLIQCSGHGLKVIPSPNTDTMGYWVTYQSGNESNALTHMASLIARYSDNPNILAWHPVDEWDHEDDGWGRPKLWSHLLCNQVRDNMPHRPCLMLCMGFLGVDAWRMVAEEADVLAVDIYPSDNGNNIEKALAKQAKYLSEMRSVLGRKKPYILVPELFQMKGSGKAAVAIVRTPAETVAQCYMGIIHGARGILLFANGHPSNPAVPKNFLDGVAQIAHELFGPEGLAQLVLPAAGAVDIAGESKIVKCSNAAIHASLFQDAKGRKTLIALNATNSPVVGVRFDIVNQSDGIISVRFETKRTIKMLSGGFSDNFDSLQRHVYDLPLGPGKIHPSIPAG
jgi:hypothetical protein